MICYKYLFRIYNELPKDFKECFKINENIIDKNIKKKVNDKDFCAIHIRYGDKLKLSIDKEKNIQFKFLIYTPKYYIKMINIFLKKNKKVYILADDPIIIKKYILNDFINNKNVELIDTDWINSFYILYKCTFLVMSLSTFSMFAAFINKNLKKAYIIIRPKDISSQYNDLLEEKVIEDTNWIKFEKKKYILNYDLQLMKEMQQYKWDFKDERLN